MLPGDLEINEGRASSAIFKINGLAYLIHYLCGQDQLEQLCSSRPSLTPEFDLTITIFIFPSYL